ncbi:acyltransferase [Enterococcus saccharolyticus]|uniref:Acyltransferase n=1 Tax=Enterococcus saccharolyticus subsp. saccharolyticus ATCC 43076 TaxID=1139996 RepID=S0NUZ2_9ENTE|nr:acyltransferase [Enterococcus saccharolyticus]EOT30777.1 hypothetical protein OMQ_00481 [Enterococcus saccharolyticus subsp. saccharolyticus ATCC 43076]EOT80338.1 hypothetical protein I572_00863 [Enterococcus saccharolyticus subsp. saccharolyticus ATCC 43076]
MGTTKRSFQEILVLVISILFSMPKSVYYSIKFCGIMKGLKIPLLIHFTTKIKANKHQINIFSMNTFGIKIGFGGSPNINSLGRTKIILKKDGRLNLNRNIVISKGAKLIIDGKVIIGENFRANKNFSISCTNEIEIGNNVLIGWDCEIRDYDGHIIRYKGEDLSENLKVSLGNHVWIGAKSTILKGTLLPNDVVVGYGSLITNSKNFKPNTIIAGVPGKIIREDVEWVI